MPDSSAIIGGIGSAIAVICFGTQTVFVKPKLLVHDARMQTKVLMYVRLIKKWKEILNPFKNRLKKERY